MEEQTYRFEQCDGKVQWDEFVLEHGGHPMQLWGWGALKSQYAWRVERFFILENDIPIGAAQLLIRRVPKPFGHWLYIPRGPIILDSTKTEVVYEQLAAYVTREHTGVALRIEPNVNEAPETDIWRETKTVLLPHHTVMLDLTRPEGVVLADMSKTIRDRIRTASEQGTAVRKCSTPEEISAVIDLNKHSAKQRGEKLHKDVYYKRLHDQLGEYSVIFGAYNGETLVGFTWLLISESVAFELFSGAITPEAEAILRWEAVRRTKQWGIPAYDLNTEPSDTSLAYGDHPYAFAGSFDLPLSWLYGLWRRLLHSRLAD